MCGIFGIVGRRRSDLDLDGALDTLRHRGPDDRGVWKSDDAWIGHRRLSILDLSDGGHQPLVHPASGVVLTYNGEIFNYTELRRQLEATGVDFRTSCDSEVLLHAYLEWGPECVQRLEGMWAFGIWDARVDRLLLSRDRFGVKPLCYAICEDALIFASEPKAIARCFPKLRRVDEVSLATLLATLRPLPGTRTFYAGIEVLPAASIGRFRPGDRTVDVRGYWDYPAPGIDGDIGDAELVEEFASLIDASVTGRLRADVPVGITLSGGIDSTVILREVSRARAGTSVPVQAYTAVYPGLRTKAVDERVWARRASRSYPNVRLVEVTAELDSWVATLERIVWSMDGPDLSPAAYPMWRIMEQARRDGIPVLLEGQGADELFAGYRSYTADNFLDRLTPSVSQTGPRRVAEASAAVRAAVRMGSWPRFAADLALTRSSIRRHQLRRTTLAPAITTAPAPGARPASGAVRGAALQARLRSDFSRDKLPGFLRYGDGVSMAHSIETRLPFLDHRLVEWAVRLPPAGRISHGETKHTLRQYLRVGDQGLIADRRDKRGYPTPTATWLAHDGGRVLRERLLDHDAVITTIVDRRGLERTIDRHVTGRQVAADALYAALTTEIWWQQLRAADRDDRAVAGAVSS